MELEGMLEAGVIHPSTGPWTSPIVIVEKKDGGAAVLHGLSKTNPIVKV